MMNNRNTVLRVLDSQKAGYVYLVKVLGTTNFKIGKTQVSVSRRIMELQIGCPLKIRYVYHACVEEMSRTEKELHSRFSSFRVIGEWFSLTHKQVSECIQLMRLVQCDESILLPIKNEIVQEEELVETTSIQSVEKEELVEATSIQSFKQMLVKPIGAILPEDVRSTSLVNILTLLGEAGITSSEVITLMPTQPDRAVWVGIKLLGKSMTATSRDIFGMGTGGKKFQTAKGWYELLRKEFEKC